FGLNAHMFAVKVRFTRQTPAKPPMTEQHILAIDQGTTSTRAILFDRSGKPLKQAQSEHEQIFPQDGWVEHNPEEIWQATLKVMNAALKGVQHSHLAAIGVTNQRETTVVWDRKTGRPIYNAIVWQDRRTAPLCAKLKQAGHEAAITAKTGLLLDPYFSGTKLAWILDNVPYARIKAEKGELAFGTIDSWLIHRLTGGRVHVTDTTNASRTLLYDIRRGRWDGEILEWLRIPQGVLPRVHDSVELLGGTDPAVLGAKIAIAGVAGDQQAAAVGQACVKEGL